MFRKMLRFKQQLPALECAEILRNEKRGVLSLLGDEGYPYGVPINHYYCEDDNTIYFHSGKKGHKIDAIKSCAKASFCVYDSGFKKDNDWALNIKSVIVFGKISLVDDFEKTLDISRKLSYKFTSDEEYIDDEIKKHAKATQLIALKIEHICGKLVNEK